MILEKISASVVVLIIGLNMEQLHITKNFLIKQFNEKPLIKNPINLGYFIFKKIISEINKESWIHF